MARVGVRARVVRRLITSGRLRPRGRGRHGVLATGLIPILPVDGDEDDDGSAGVREPRRPVHPPSDLAAQQPLP